jgi:hypothetical protein
MPRGAIMPHLPLLMQKNNFTFEEKGKMFLKNKNKIFSPRI